MTNRIIEIYHNGSEIAQTSCLLEYREITKNLTDYSAYGFLRGDMPAACFHIAAGNKFSPFNPRGRAALVQQITLTF